MTRPVAGTTMKVRVERDRCIAVGNCAAIAPAVFDQRDDDGTVVLLDATPPQDQHDPVRDAALRCPAAAIAFRQNGPARDE